MLSQSLTVKTCRKCLLDKPITEFFRKADSRDGHQSLCKSCRREYKRAEYVIHRDKVQARNKRWYERNRESQIFRTSRNARQNAPARRDARFRRTYGVSLVEIEAIREAQGGVCAICRDPKRPGRKSLCVDHCHRTGRVRGLLCHQCNKAIGLFGDSPSHLHAAIAYLGAG